MNANYKIINRLFLFFIASLLSTASLTSQTCTLAAGVCTPCAAGETTTNVDLTTGSIFAVSEEFSGSAPAVQPTFDGSMGTLTLPTGADETYAVAGFNNVALPSVITDICFTIDIDVVSGDFPFLVLLRLENQVPGQQLQYYMMADGTGMCSLGGSAADGNPAGAGLSSAADFFANNTTGLYNVVIGLEHFGGDPLTTARTIDFSNISLSTCTVPGIPGCTDPTASNYDPNATVDDGSCMTTGPSCTLAAGTCTPCAASETTTNVDITTGNIFAVSDEFSGSAPAVQPTFDGSMGTLTLPTGADETYAVAGFNDVALPSVINDICFTLDIDVISGDFPFLVLLRLENQVPGQQLQYYMMADGTGMCSLGGSAADGNPAGAGLSSAADFFANNTTGLYNVVIGLEHFGGDPLPTARTIDFSNISLSTCSPTGTFGCTDINSMTYDPAATVDDGSCEYLYTFNVDTNCPDFADDPSTDQTIGMVGISGPFAMWCGGCNDMTDNGSGIYSITLQLPVQSLEYKYQTHDGAGNWLNQEQLVDDVIAGGTCAPVTDGANFANRQITLPAMDMTFDDVFGSCDACPNACPPSLSLSAAEAGTMDYESSGNISSTSVIASGAMIDYDSATDIDLNPDFEVVLGAVFCAFIDGCGGAAVNDDDTSNLQQNENNTEDNKNVESSKE